MYQESLNNGRIECVYLGVVETKSPLLYVRSCVSEASFELGKKVRKILAQRRRVAGQYSSGISFILLTGQDVGDEEDGSAGLGQGQGRLYLEPRAGQDQFNLF